MIGRGEEERKEQKERLHTEWEEMNDWWGRCRKCGEIVRGTPKAIRSHSCGDNDVPGRKQPSPS